MIFFSSRYLYRNQVLLQYCCSLNVLARQINHAETDKRIWELFAFFCGLEMNSSGNMLNI